MNRHLILAAAAAAAAVFAGGCTSHQTPPFDPRGLGDAQRDASKGLARPTAQTLPEKLDSLADSTIPPAEKFRDDDLHNRLSQDPRTVLVDLRTAIQKAVVNNRDVRVSAYTPAIDETRVTEADARFDLTTFANLSIEKNRGQAQSIGGVFTNQQDFDRVTLETGIKTLTDLGGEISLSLNTQYINPGAEPSALSGQKQYFNELKLQLTQPLLRDFGSDVNRARIVINKNNQHISLLDFREKLEDTLTRLEQTYWQLVQAQAEVDIQQELLENTVKTADTLWRRREQDVTRLQISQANASLESRRAQLVRAKARVGDLSDQLKQYMSDPNLPVAGNDLLLPASPPIVQQVVFNPQEQIESALLNRGELGQQQLRVDNALTALGVARNNELPRLDLVGSASIQGLEEQYGPSIGEIFTDATDPYEGVISLGLQFEYPLGNRAAKAIYRRAMLQYLQSSDSYRQIIEQVVLDVKRAMREVETTWTEVIRTRQSEFASADALRSVQIREDAGEALTPEFVDLKLRQQEILAQSKRDRAAAESNYNIGLSTLERAKGTLLKYNNVVMSEASLPANQ
jgi:outer membrane protein TolC